MVDMRAPIPLPALLDVMGDRRPIFMDYRICDNAAPDAAKR